MAKDVAATAEGAFWVSRVLMLQEDLTEFAQQITFRHPDLERPVENHHTDPELAKAAGFPKPVAEPLHYLAYFDNVMLHEYGQAWLDRGEMQASILGAVYAEDAIELRVGSREMEEPYVARHKFAVLNAEGELVTVGFLSVHNETDPRGE